MKKNKSTAVLETKPKLEAITSADLVIMKRSSFEHLLNLIASQEFVSEAPKLQQREMKSSIDDYWRQGMDLLKQ